MCEVISFSRLPTARFRSGPRWERNLSRGKGCGPKSPQLSQNDAQRLPKCTKKRAKTNKGSPKRSPAEKYRFSNLDSMKKISKERFVCANPIKSQAKAYIAEDRKVRYVSLRPRPGEKRGWRCHGADPQEHLQSARSLRKVYKEIE